MKENSPQSNKEYIKDFPRELVRSMLVEMLRIRVTEERLGDLVAEDEIKCPCHLYIGQEAIAVGVCAALKNNDYVFGTHRSHGHYLAKGGSLKLMVAEIFGRKTGCSRGRGGSMHLTAPEVGIMGTSAIVASGIPPAVGAAIAFAMQGTDRVAVTFFGDGAVDEGVFYESLNIASLRQAPVIFVCENNLYSTHMHILQRRPADNLPDIARAHCLSAVSIDGNDVLTVYRTAREAVENARRGKGPMFIECRTYRWRGHVGPNYDIDKGLRSQKELDKWMARCPIKLLEKQMMAGRLLTREEAQSLRKEVRDDVEAAISFARQSPYPESSELTDYVFTTK